MEASPEAGFSYTPDVINSIQSTASFTDESTGGTGWYWDFGGEARSFQRNPTYTFQDTGRHDIMQIVFHPNGCTDTLIKTIDIEPVVQFFLPNAFTPNSDGKNETYKPKGLSEGVSYYNLGIWTRWGEKVFESTEKTKGWDGIYKGRPADVGVFGWYLKVKCYSGDETFKKGNVTLIR